ncbi:TNT domain-containing protein [Metabacillus halosaccharovorans]
MGNLYYVLKKGMLIDRFGAPGGGFFSPEGIPYEQRALELDSDGADYYIYRVLEDFDVTIGKIAPWFDIPGGGTQFIKYHSNGKAYSIEELEELELVEFVSVKKGG